MNKTTSSPWEDISIPAKSFYHKKLADPTMAIHCHWAKDGDGSFLFLIELEGRHDVAFQKNLVRLKGIDIDLRSIEAKKQIIVLTLEKKIDEVLFENFCRALIKVMNSVERHDVALEVFFEHVKRWKAFLSGSKKTMSQEQLLGLFGELTFLKELINVRGEDLAINSWLGADRGQHDFSFYNNDVEVKTLQGTERNTVRISSEDQLFTLNKNLFLRVYCLREQPTDGTGTSLNQVVNEVNELIQDINTADAFFDKLNDYGYCPLVDYDRPFYSVSKLDTYLVKDGFPKLTKNFLPEGISHVNYQISLEKIESFKCDPTKVMEV